MHDRPLWIGIWNSTRCTEYFFGSRISSNDFVCSSSSNLKRTRRIGDDNSVDFKLGVSLEDSIIKLDGNDVGSIRIYE